MDEEDDAAVVTFCFSSIQHTTNIKESKGNRNKREVAVVEEDVQVVVVLVVVGVLLQQAVVQLERVVAVVKVVVEVAVIVVEVERAVSKLYPVLMRIPL